MRRRLELLTAGVRNLRISHEAVKLHAICDDGVTVSMPYVLPNYGQLPILSNSKIMSTDFVPNNTIVLASGKWGGYVPGPKYRFNTKGLPVTEILVDKRTVLFYRSQQEIDLSYSKLFFPLAFKYKYTLPVSSNIE